MFAALDGRPRIGGTDDLGPTNATRHGPEAGGRAVSEVDPCTGERIDSSTPWSGTGLRSGTNWERRIPARRRGSTRPLPARWLLNCRRLAGR